MHLNVLHALVHVLDALLDEKLVGADLVQCDLRSCRHVVSDRIVSVVEHVARCDFVNALVVNLAVHHQQLPLEFSQLLCQVSFARRAPPTTTSRLEGAPLRRWLKRYPGNTKVIAATCCPAAPSVAGAPYAEAHKEHAREQQVQTDRSKQRYHEPKIVAVAGVADIQQSRHVSAGLSWAPRVAMLNVYEQACRKRSESPVAALRH